MCSYYESSSGKSITKGMLVCVLHVCIFYSHLPRSSYTILCIKKVSDRKHPEFKRLLFSRTHWLLWLPEEAWMPWRAGLTWAVPLISALAAFLVEELEYHSLPLPPYHQLWPFLSETSCVHKRNRVPSCLFRTACITGAPSVSTQRSDQKFLCTQVQQAKAQLLLTHFAPNYTF